MSNAVLIGGAVAIGAYALHSASDRPANAVVPAHQVVTGIKPLSGVSVSLKAAVPRTITGAGKTTTNMYTATGSSSAGNADFRAQQAEAARRAQEYVESNFAKLSAAEKLKGAAALNASLKLNPPLKGTESYKEIANRAGAALGSQACSAAGIGFAEHYCAIAGAYLGVKAAELGKRVGTAIAGAAVGAAKAVGGAVADGASKVWNSIF